VLAVFVVAAIILVNVGTRPTVSGVSQGTVTTTTTAGSAGGTTTTTVTVQRSSVSVLVANATSSLGLAGRYTTALGAQGWAMQTAADASGDLPTSSVYYKAGEQPAASAIATSLGLKPAVVLPLTTAVPVAGAANADVVVVVGADLVTPASG
jgi:hypothetical protein